MGDRPSPVGPRGLALVAGAAVLLLAASLAAVLLLPGLSGGPAGTPTSGIAAGEGFLCDPNEAASLTPFLDGVVLVATDRVARLDLSGRTLWSVPLSFSSPVAAVSGGRLLVHDEGGFLAALFDADGLVWQVETEGHLDGATVSASGHVVLLSEETGYKGVIAVHAPDGAFLYAWKSAETGYLLSAAADPTGTRVEVSALYTDGASARPVMRSFSLSGQSLAQKTLDAGDALPLVLFDEMGRTALCGESAVVAFQAGQRAGEVAYRIDRAGLRTVLATDEGLVLVRASDDGAGTVASRIRNGTEGPACALPAAPSAVASRGGRLAAASGSAVDLVDLAKGTVEERMTFAEEVLALGFADDRHLIVVTKGAVRRVDVS